MLRRSAAGAAAGALALSAPSITGFGAAPAFGQAASCIESLTAVVVTGEATVFGFTIPSLTTPVTVVPDGAGNCSAGITFPADPTLPSINVSFAITLSNGDMITGMLNPQTGGTVSGTFSCATGVPVSVLTVSGSIAGFDINLPVASSTEIVSCA